MIKQNLNDDSNKPIKLNLKKVVIEIIELLIDKEFERDIIRDWPYERWYVAILLAVDVIDRRREDTGCVLKGDFSTFKSYWLTYKAFPKYYTLNDQSELDWFYIYLEDAICLFWENPESKLFIKYREALQNDS